MSINWDNFVFFAIATLLCWSISALFSLFSEKKSNWAIGFSIIGLVIFSFFMIGCWFFISRPPFRTMGETRLWFSLLLSLAGLLIYLYWHYRYILSFTTILSSIFIIINILHPEIHDKELMPALQSIWFVPHVVIYMLAYAFLGSSFLMAIYYCIKKEKRIFFIIDNLVRIGFGAFTIGMFIGALWAKEAWGDFWAWDPKETWALLTWLLYLIYLMFRQIKPKNQKTAIFLLIFAFIFLLICWIGVNYLPYPEKSLHLYK